MSPRILVIDGYDAPGQASLNDQQCTLAGPLYKAMLTRFLPSGSIDVINISLDQAANVELSDYDGACWTGSNMSLTRVDKYVQRNIDMSRALFSAGIPQFGSCWAAQLCAAAAGGAVGKNAKGREFGLARKIYQTAEGREHPMYRGKPIVFDGFTSHGDIVTQMPQGGVLLSANEFTPVQGLAVTHENGEFWAIQYHPEYDCGELAALTRVRKGALIDQGTFADDGAATRYSTNLETLNNDPARQDIAWRMGIDDDVLNAETRTAEVRNWLNHFFKLAL